MRFTVIGAGLAGTEAAWQIANAGHPVTLLEMKPVQYSPAHTSPLFAELVCSNSLKAARLESAAGLLKEEMARLGSLTVPIARQCAVPAGGALAVDREQFASRVTAAVEAHPNITVEHRVVTEVPRGADQITVVASGPLTADDLASDIERLCPGRLSFYDAAAPIITAESVDYTKVFGASRYDRGEADYLNCPFNKAEYEAFHAALAAAERAPLHDFDTGAEQSAQPDPDAHGKKVDFKNTIIIMTSNAGANRIISPKTLGFGQVKTSEEEYKKMKEGVMEEVKHIFKPEFINRVDEMIVFHALNKENIKDITKIMLKQFAKRVKNQMDMELCIADDVVDFISDKGFDKDYGARPIRRALQTELEDVLAEAVLMEDISIGDTVDVSLSCEGTKKKIVVKKKTFADEKK